MKTCSVLAASLLAAVSSPVMAQAWLPAEGIWQIDGANGSGLTLDVRDTAIGIGLYTYDEEGVATWYSGAGSLSDAGVLDAELTRFEDGDGDTPTAVGTLDISLSFSASATGTLAVGDADAVPVRHFAFGADYIGGVEFEGEGGVVTAIPDLRGRWVIAPAGPDQGGTLDLTFLDVLASSDALQFSTDADAEGTPSDGAHVLTCAPSPNLDMPPDRCTLARIDAEPSLQTVPLATFDPGDLSATRIAGDSTDPIAFRVPTGINVPQSGIWQIAGRFGEGVTLDVRNNFAAIGVYGYDAEGNATWSLATGPLENTADGYSMEGDLVTFTGGSCLGCDHTDATVDETRPVRVDFIGATRARVTIGDGEPMALSLLPFGTEYFPRTFAGDPDAEEFGPHALPQPAGAWVQASVYGTMAVGADPLFPAVTFVYDDVEAAGIDDDTYNVLLATPGDTWEPEDGPQAPSLACEVGIGDDVADCDLIHPGVVSPPTAPESFADILPWNISGNRISGVSLRNGVTPERVYLFRVPPQPMPAPSR